MQGIGFTDPSIAKNVDVSRDIKFESNVKNANKSSSVKVESNFVDKIGKFASEAGSKVGGAVHALAAGAAKDLGGIGAKIAGKMGGDIAGKFAGQMGAKLDSQISKVTGGFLNPNLKGAIGGFAKNLTGELGEGITKNLAGGLGNAIEDISKGEFTKAFTDIGKGIEDSIKFSSNKISEKWKELTEGKKEKKYERPEIIPLPRIIGLPPLPKEFVVTNDMFEIDDEKKAVNIEAEMTKDTFPILEIIPCKPVGSLLKGGLDLYILKSCWQDDDEAEKKSFFEYMYDYYHIDVGYNRRMLRVACLHESPISETFSNDFRDSIFESIASGASQGWVRDVAQMTNVHSGEQIANMFGTTGANLKSGAEKALQMMGMSGEGAKKFANLGASLANVAMESALGHGLDFPQVWSTSNYSPSYSFTVRLYNPYPGDPIAIDKYLVAPLTVLLSFVVPRSVNGYQFYQPWLCKIRMKGLIPETPCYMSNLTIVKGGDHNQIGWNQKAGIVDVKMDFKILYKVMVATRKTKKVQVPQLHKWLNEFNVNRGYNANDDKNELKPIWYRTPLKKDSPLSKLLKALGLGEINKYLKGTNIDKVASKIISNTENAAIQMGTNFLKEGMKKLEQGAKYAYNMITSPNDPIPKEMAGGETPDGKYVPGSQIPPNPVPPTPTEKMMPQYPTMIA